MYEICALLRQKKAPKARKPSAPKIFVGAAVTVGGGEEIGTVVGRDTKYANAWFVEFPGRTKVWSFSRDMIFLVK